MQIRPSLDSDLAAVTELFTASVHQLASSDYDAAQCAVWAPRPPDAEVWRERLSSRQTLVAEEGGSLAGFIAFEEDGHIDLLFTAPSFARRGVASLLLQSAESRLSVAGVGGLFTEASLTARPFFERHGFTVTEEEQVQRGGVSFRRFAMHKPLRAHR